MAPHPTRKSSGRKQAHKSRWLMAGAGLSGIVAAGLLTAALLSARDDGMQDAAGLCPHFDTDPNTGKMRDRGRIPCSGATVQNGRIDLIRKSFNQH
jgi:hypothetical protein